MRHERALGGSTRERGEAASGHGHPRSPRGASELPRFVVLVERHPKAGASFEAAQIAGLGGVVALQVVIAILGYEALGTASWNGWSNAVVGAAFGMTMIIVSNWKVGLGGLLMDLSDQADRFRETRRLANEDH